MPNLSIKLRAISVGSENKIAYLITFCWVCLPALSKSISLANAFSISDPIKEAKIKFVLFSATKSNGPKDCDSYDIISSKPISYPFCLRFPRLAIVKLCSVLSDPVFRHLSHNYTFDSICHLID